MCLFVADIREESRYYKRWAIVGWLTCAVLTVLLIMLLFTMTQAAPVTQQMQAPRYTYRAFKFPHPDDPLGLLKNPQQYNHFRRPI